MKLKLNKKTLAAALAAILAIVAAVSQFLKDADKLPEDGAVEVPVVVDAGVVPADAGL